MVFNTDSKTAPAPYQNDPRVERDADGNWHVRGYNEARDLLKEDLIQDGFNAEALRKAGFDGVLYMSGEPHRHCQVFQPNYCAEHAYDHYRKDSRRTDRQAPKAKTH